MGQEFYGTKNLFCNSWQSLKYIMNDDKIACQQIFEGFFVFVFDGDFR